MDRILVVDDSPLIQTTLAHWLGAAGYEVECASDATTALATIAERPPQLVLLDLLMPGIDGLEACQALKSSDTTERIPVVVLTSAGSSENRIRALEVGAEDFLTKPVARDELLARVRSLLRSKRLSDRLLLSFVELDKLGAFAEAFTAQGATEWEDAEVANSLARHVLGFDGPLANHPSAIWAGHIVGASVRGYCWYWLDGQWHRVFTEFPPFALTPLLEPYARDGGEYLSKTPPPPALVTLLQLPRALPLGNFVAMASNDHWLVAVGYPWEVGAYEMPLLRALYRHWGVFERLRSESRLAEQAFFSTIEALALAAEFYDRETANHIRRVSAYADLVARALGQTGPFLKWISRSASLHDVGKITVPLDIVRKPDLLSGQERSAMRRHTVNGAKIIGDLGPLAVARNIALSHHENMDGSGYPNGLRGEEIPLEARIVRVVDVYDALRTPRAYKQAFTHEQAIEVLRRGDDRVSPGHLDPRVLAAILDHHQEAAALHVALSRDHPSGPFKVLPTEEPAP